MHVGTHSQPGAWEGGSEHYLDRLRPGPCRTLPGKELPSAPALRGGPEPAGGISPSVQVQPEASLACHPAGAASTEGAWGGPRDRLLCGRGHVPRGTWGGAERKLRSSLAGSLRLVCPSRAPRNILDRPGLRTVPPGEPSGLMCRGSPGRWGAGGIGHLRPPAGTLQALSAGPVWAWALPGLVSLSLGHGPRGPQ